MKRRFYAALACFCLVLGFALYSCKHEDAKPDSALVSTPAKDPGDYSSLRKFPLKDLIQSEVKVAGNTIPVYVMDDDAKEAEGFMYLREQDVPNGHGMIFIMPKTAQQGFWMQHCFMELDIAFIGPKGNVLNVVRGKKFDETNLPSKGPAKYVLELKPGEAAKFGVRAGAKIEIPSDLTYHQ